MKRILPIATLLITLSGCALWSDFKAPDTDTPQAWKEGAISESWPESDWWKQFNSPALSAQIDEAGKSNYDLKAAVARVQQADAQARIAGANLLPSIGVDGTLNRIRTSGSSRSASALGVASRPNIVNAYTATLSSSYEVDFWGRNWSSAQSAEALAKASRYDQQTVTLTTLSTVANNYFDILATQERLRIARENLSNSEQLLNSIHKRFEQGMIAGLDVARQENVVATQLAAIPPLELRLSQAMNAQAILLGKLPEALALPETKLSDIAIPEVGAGIPSALLQRRPDVQNAEAQLASAHADIIQARSAFFPNISLTAEGGYESAALARLFRPDSIFWALGSSLAQPIFDGGRLQGELDLAKARYDELLQNYRKAIIAAFSDVEDALAAVKQTRAEEAAQKVAEETARKAYSLSQQQFKGGIVDITSVLDTQRTLFASQDAYAQARLSHLQAIVSLYRALGGGWKNGS